MTPALTALAMLAFAGNSVLGRLALGDGLIDAGGYAVVRTFAGALILAVIVVPRCKLRRPRPSDWIPAFVLFLYMAGFSFAYLSLATGTGALILFGAVQITMITAALYAGEKLPPASWLGFAVAIGGLVWLVFPGLTAPDPAGSLLMAVAGVAWGLYSLLGRGRGDPTLRTARNFALCAPLTLVLGAVSYGPAQWTGAGIAAAAASGAVTSGLGYTIWYAAVPRLTATQAASVQLTVPVIASLLGVLLLAETLTFRLVLASAAILGGVGIVVANRQPRST